MQNWVLGHLQRVFMCKWIQGAISRGLIALNVQSVLEEAIMV